VPALSGRVEGARPRNDADVNDGRCVSVSSNRSTAWSCLEHGAGLQRTLLEAEGIEFDEHGYIDLERFGWAGLPWPEIEGLLNR
jgi:hypothetical protein